jgi:hypothetical protein
VCGDEKDEPAGGAQKKKKDTIPWLTVFMDWTVALDI